MTRIRNEQKNVFPHKIIQLRYFLTLLVFFCVSVFFSSSSFFVHHSLCVKTAHPLSLSLSPLKKSTKKRTRRNSIIRETLILRKKNERTIKRIEQNTLFIYSLSLSLVLSEKRVVVSLRGFCQNVREAFFSSSLSLFCSSFSNFFLF